MKLKVISLILIFSIFSHSDDAFTLNRERPNVILITIDALRADHLGCYGYERDTSPHIDKFAKEGTLFRQAIASCSSTFASLPSLFTSTYYYTHGVKNWGSTINPKVPTLAQILKENGYYAGAICAEDFFVNILGLDKGFDTVSTGIDLKAGEITEKALVWLKKNKRKIFFLWLHYFDTHEPYRPPSPFDKMFVKDKTDGNIKLVPILKDNPSDSGIFGGVGGVEERQLINGIRDMDFYISQYDGAIRFVDEQIGILLDGIGKLKLNENTIIIITADHGESMGEHNLYFSHGRFLYDELLKVPLIIKVSNLIPKVKVIKTQVKLLDVMPTILDILGIRPKRRIEGASLLPLIHGKENKSLSPFAFSYINTERYSIRTEGYKLICFKSENKYELYNLKDDPKELDNLVKFGGRQFEFLKAKLDKYMEEGLTMKEKTQNLEEHIKEKLKSLGYTQ